MLSMHKTKTTTTTLLMLRIELKFAQFPLIFQQKEKKNKAVMGEGRVF